MERKQQHVHAHAQTQDASTLTRAWHRRQGPPYPVPTTTWTLVRVIEALQLEKAPSLSRTRDMSVSGPLGLGGMDRQPGGEHGAWSMGARWIRRGPGGESVKTLARYMSLRAVPCTTSTLPVVGVASYKDAAMASLP